MKMKHIIPMVLFASATMTVDAQAQLKSGIDMSNLDTSVRPVDDFYKYACGGWMKNNPLPAAYSRFGSFDQLALDNNKRINSILTDLLKTLTRPVRQSRSSATFTSWPWTPCAATLKE